jgi:molecular chaperone GrpE (heat shock protein)
MSEKQEKAAKRMQAAAKTARKAHMKKQSQRAAVPVKKPEETPHSTVRGKIEATNKQIDKYKEGAAEIHTGIRAMEADINKQIDKYKDAIAVFHASVGDFNDSILAQSKENEKAAAAIYSGIEAMRSSIEDKIRENAGYVKNFYG